MTNDIRFTDARPRTPRRVIAYSSGRRATYRNVTRDDSGRPEIVVEANDIATVKLDFTDTLERGESIEEATATAADVTSSITYDNRSILLTVINPSNDGTIIVEARTNFGEQFTERLVVRLPKRCGEERRIATVPFVRGVP